jgi:hypothetical protein
VGSRSGQRNSQRLPATRIWPPEIYRFTRSASHDLHAPASHDLLEPVGVGVGRAHAGTRVLLLAADQHVSVITDDGELLRELTIDPTRNDQPRRT